jgi:hypothetical protein
MIQSRSYRHAPLAWCWTLCCIVGLVAWTGTAHGEAGTGNLSGKGTIAVRGCGKQRLSIDVRVVVRDDATWEAEDAEGARFAGTYVVGTPNGRKLELTFDAPSTATFVMAASEEVAFLCEAPVTVASVDRRKFSLRLNRKRTKAVFVLLYRLTGSAAGESGSARYRITAKGPWTAAAITAARPSAWSAS